MNNPWISFFNLMDEVVLINMDTGMTIRHANKVDMAINADEGVPEDLPPVGHIAINNQIVQGSVDIMAKLLGAQRAPRP